MRRSIASLGLVALLGVGCSATPQPVTQPPPPTVQETQEKVVEDLTPIYEQLELGERQYLASMNPSNSELADKLRWEADMAFTQAADLCDHYSSCHPSIITDAFSRIVSEQIDKNAELVTEPQYFEKEEPPIFLEPASESPTLRQGDSLEGITEMNGPVREAVRHWLINKREIFIESYINFLFLEEMITRNYDEAGFPLALAFGMGAQESNFKTNAYSRAKAAGIWQFMCDTAKEFELSPRDSPNCPERFDPEKATEANIRYLKTALENFNGDWLRTIASYNTGIRRQALQGDKDYWELEQEFRGFLAKETKPYVRQIVSAMLLFDDIRNNADEYNLANSLPEIDPSLVEVTLQNDASLSELAACMGSPPWLVSWKQILRNINPVYGIDTNKLISAGSTILIPGVSLEGYENYCIDSPLWALLEDERPKFKRHLIRSGDHYGKVASLYAGQCGMSESRMASELRRVNPWSDRGIPIGKWMTVPCGQ